MMRTPSSRKAWGSVSLFLFLTIALPPQLFAQSLHFASESSRGGDSGRYVIRTGPEDQLLIDVQIWGQVYRPGQYSVPDRTDLVGLMSYAGGPTEGAKLKNVQVLRPLATVDRVRVVDLEAFLKSGNPDMIPRLSPGDVVVVRASRSHGLSRLAGFVSVAALVANVAVLATRN